MPADFLMPLFVLTLLANAVLVAFAIRGTRNGQLDPDRSWPGGDRSPTRARAGSEPRSAEAIGTGAVSAELPEDVRRAIASGRAAAVGGWPPEPTSGPVPSPDPEPMGDPLRVVEPAPVVEPVPVIDVARAVDKAPPTRPGTASRRRPATGPGTDPDDARPAGTKRGRRRFSLPNLDDDHEKVSRSIETFLGGAEAIGGDGAAPQDGTPSNVGGGGPTTVVLVAVAGLPAEADRTAPGAPAKTPRRRAIESGPVSDALALIERSLRNAARGTDIVTGGGRGRFRIVMASTGELAARAYLRRVRTTVEPGLEAVGTPLRLVVATATVLDEPVEVAIRRATDRLSAAFEAAAAVGRDARSADRDDRPDDTSSAPRAAVD